MGGAGSNGINAFTITTAALTLPAAMGTVTALVGSSLFMAVGEPLFLSDGTNQANFKVVSFPGPTSVLLQWLNYPGDAATGTVIAANAILTPTGLLGSFVSPLPIASGGTGAASVAAALVAFGLPTGFHAGTYVQNGATPVTVTDANVTANSVIVITLKTVGGTVGVQPHVATITPTTGFTVVGTAGDLSVYSYLIIG
jgi:hypothetical protein